MTQIDRDGRAGGRVDSAITVAIRSAGGVNEGAETLKAEGATHVLLGDWKCSLWPCQTNKTINFKSMLTEFGAQTLLVWVNGVGQGRVGQYRASAVSYACYQITTMIKQQQQQCQQCILAHV